MTFPTETLIKLLSAISRQPGRKNLKQPATDVIRDILEKQKQRLKSVRTLSAGQTSTIDNLEGIIDALEVCIQEVKAGKEHGHSVLLRKMTAHLGYLIEYRRKPLNQQAQISLQELFLQRWLQILRRMEIPEKERSKVIKHLEELRAMCSTNKHCSYFSGEFNNIANALRN